MADVIIMSSAQFIPVAKVHEAYLLVDFSCFASKTGSIRNALYLWMNSLPVEIHQDVPCYRLDTPYFNGRNSLRPGGRLYNRGPVSERGIQALPSVLRNFLLEMIGKDLDIKNCYPTAAFGYFERADIKAPFLQRYVTNRAAVISTIAGAPDYQNAMVGPAQIKQAVATIMNGGDPTTRSFQRNGEMLSVGCVPSLHPWLLSFQKEYIKCRDQLVLLPEHKTLFDAACCKARKRNMFGKRFIYAMVQLLEEVECRAMQLLVDELSGIFPSFHMNVNLFDGSICTFAPDITQTQVDDALTRVNLRIARESKHTPLAFGVKPLSYASLKFLMPPFDEFDTILDTEPLLLRGSWNRMSDCTQLNLQAQDLYVKASFGAGKTYMILLQIAALLALNRDLSVLFVSARRTFTTALLALMTSFLVSRFPYLRTRIFHYSDIPGDTFDLKIHQISVWQVESCTRLPLHCKFNVVVLDEIQQIMSHSHAHLVTGKEHKFSHRVESGFAKVINCARICDHILGSDNDLTSAIANSFTALRPAKPYLVVENRASPWKRMNTTVHLQVGRHGNAFLSGVALLLKEVKRLSDIRQTLDPNRTEDELGIAVCCHSKVHTQILFELCQQVLRENGDDSEICLYNADTSETVKQHDFRDVTTRWNSIRIALVIANLVLTVGVSNTSSHIRLVFAFFGDQLGFSVITSCQALFRHRCAQLLWIFVDHSLERDVPTTPAGIATWVVANQINHRSLPPGLFLHFSQQALQPSLVAPAADDEKTLATYVDRHIETPMGCFWMSVLLETFRSRCFFVARLREKLMGVGCVVHTRLVDTRDIDSSMRTALKFRRQEIALQRADAVQRLAGQWMRGEINTTTCPVQDRPKVDEGVLCAQSYGVDLSHAAPGWIEYYAPLQNSWELRRRHYTSSHAAASLGRLVAVTEAELLQKISRVILSDGLGLHMAAPSHTLVDVSAPSLTSAVVLGIFFKITPPSDSKSAPTYELQDSCYRLFGNCYKNRVGQKATSLKKKLPPANVDDLVDFSLQWRSLQSYVNPLLACLGAKIVPMFANNRAKQRHTVSAYHFVWLHESNSAIIGCASDLVPTPIPHLNPVLASKMPLQAMFVEHTRLVKQSEGAQEQSENDEDDDEDDFMSKSQPKVRRRRSLHYLLESSSDEGSQRDMLGGKDI